MKNQIKKKNIASWRSKGVLDVSARTAIKNNIKTGSKGIIYQIACWLSMIIVKLKVPVNNMIIRIAALKINS